jgi:hypothetical protein
MKMIKLKTLLCIMLLILVLPAASAMAGGFGPFGDHDFGNHKGDHKPHGGKNKCPWSSFGESSLVIELISACDAYPDCFSDGTFTYGGVTFEKSFGYLRFQDIFKLSTDYNVTDTDCGGGSPRFSIEIKNAGGNTCSIAGDSCNIFVYIGPYPNFTGCDPGWQSTGNLIGSPDLRFDTSQLVGGTFYDSYSDALALAGPVKVLGIDLVVDGGWTNPGAGQDILVDNVMVNNSLLNANDSGGFCQDDNHH